MDDPDEKYAIYDHRRVQVCESLLERAREISADKILYVITERLR